ncbi:MAG: hypothetical protein AAGA25_00085 [Planctomycetota bacterium]
MSDAPPPKPEKTPEPKAPKDAAPTKRRRRPGGWRKRWAVRIVLASLLLAAIPLVLAVHYTRPHNLRPLLENLLSEELGGDLTIGRASLSWGGLLSLEHFWLDVPNLPKERDEFAKLFEAERLAVQLNFSKLWRGELKIDDIQIDHPQLHIIEDLDTGELNLEMLQLGDDDDEGPEGFNLTLPPAINLNAARVRFAQVQAGEFKTIEAVRLEGELRENPDQDSLFDFELLQYDSEARVDATLTGSLNTDAPSLNLNLDGFRIDASHRQLVPAGFRELWDQLQPTGKLPSLSIYMDANEQGQLQLDEAILELDNVAITPPYEELGRAPSEPEQGMPYNPRMTEVSGRFVVRRDSVRVEDFTGNIEGIRYYASGSWGFDPESKGMIAVSTDPFTLDEDPKFLASLPMVGVKIFQRLRPSGKFQASTRFERQPGESVEVSGVIKLLEARGMYHKFPFPIHNMRGVITFDRDTVRIDNLSGDGPNGGTVRINGEISPPADGAAVRIAVEARGVPFDEAIKNAFSEKRRKGVEMFFDPEMYAALVEEQVIRPSPVRDDVSDAEPLDLASIEVDPDLPPVFDMGGPVDVDVLVDRAFGPDSKYTTTVSIDARGVSALFRHWPYPLTGKSGKIVVGPGGITLNELVMESPTGGVGTLNGKIAQESKNAPMVPDLLISDADLPIDKLLLHSIRAEQRQTVVDLFPEGRLTGRSTVTRPNPEGNTQWRVYADVVNGTLRPFDGDYRLSAVAGKFVLGNDGLTLNNLNGQRGDAKLGITGYFDWGGDQDDFRLDVVGNNIRVEPALLDLLPPDEPIREKLVTLQENHSPAGNVDAELRWEKLDLFPADAETDKTYLLKVRPKTFGMDFQGDRLEFSDMAGQLTVRPGTIDVDRLSAAFSTGTTEVNGLIGLDGVTPTALTLAANADTHCPYTRKFLPAKAVDVLNGLEVTGDYRLSDARLLYRPAPEPDQSSLELDARIDLVDTNLKLGVPLTHLQGKLEARIRQYPQHPKPLMAFDLYADELRASERRVAPLTVSLANTPKDPEHLRFDPMLGGVYGGVLVGAGSIPLNKEGSYRFDLTLSDVEVEPFLKPAAADPTHPEAPTVLSANNSDASQSTPDQAAAPVPFSAMDRNLSTGLLSASLTIEAPLSDADARRGRGALLITDARLIDKPLSTALLRASNLTLPSGAPLKSASARYLVEGDTVRFDELSLAGPSLTIAGAGTMTLPQTDLNLVMVSRNTAAPRLGPVSDLVNLFKDELLAIRVTGTLESPKTNVTSLRGLQRGWQDLFGGQGATMDTRDNLVDE